MWHRTASVEVIGKDCFYSCESLCSVTFESGSCLRKIRENAFCGSESLREIEIPAGVELIECECFGPTRTYRGNVDRESGLVRIAFASGSRLQSLANGTFSYNLMLSEIEIPANVDSIGYSCFRYCTSLTRVTFASGSKLRKIGSSAFSNCTDLHEIDIPDTVEYIHELCYVWWW